jgi:Holliday junction resolvase RusA-like endonuclease
VIHLSIDLKPLPKERPRFNARSGHAYTPSKTAKYESHIKFHAQCVCKKPMTGAVEIEIKFNFIKAKSSKLIACTKRPDIDNLIKGVLDALNGVAFMDDSQIVRLVSEKNFSSKDGIEIFITEI